MEVLHLFLLLLFWLITFTGAHDVCNEINLYANRASRCIETTVDGKQYTLFPSFTDNKFHLQKTTDRPTVHIKLGEYIIETDAILHDDTNSTRCDGIFPFGKYSPVWQIWSYVLFEASHTQLKCADAILRDTFSISNDDIWTINGKNFSVVVDLTENSFTPSTAQLPHGSGAYDQFTLSYPLLTNLSYVSNNLDLSSFSMPSIFSITPDIFFSNPMEVRLNIYSNIYFGILVEGTTQQTRSYILLSSTIDNWYVYFNLVSTIVILWISGMFSFYRVTVLRYGYPATYWKQSNKSVRIAFNVVVCIIFFLVVYTNMVGLFWCEQLCLITDYCFTSTAAVICAILIVTIGIGVLTLIYDALWDTSMNNLFFHGISLSWVYITALPFTWSTSSMILWLMMVTLLQILVNYEYMGVCNFTLLSTKLHRYTTLAIVSLIVAFYNIVTVALVVIPVCKMFFSTPLHARLMTCFYIFMFQVNIPLLFFLYARIVLQQRLIKKEN